MVLCQPRLRSSRGGHASVRMNGSQQADHLLVVRTASRLPMLVASARPSNTHLHGTCVGLNRQQLEHIAKRGTAVNKVSRRDLPLVLAKGLDGATTVSATMLLASLAGIKVFVTGGIGGVHRRVQDTCKAQVSGL